MKLVEVIIQAREALLMWHGTSTASLRSILKQGLLPFLPKSLNQRNFGDDHTARSYDGVYLNKEYGYASSYAKQHAAKFRGKPVVILCSVVPNSDNTRIDEDFLIHAFDGVVKAFQYWKGKHTPEFEKQLLDRFKKDGITAYQIKRKYESSFLRWVDKNADLVLDWIVKSSEMRQAAADKERFKKAAAAANAVAAPITKGIGGFIQGMVSNPANSSIAIEDQITYKGQTRILAIWVAEEPTMRLVTRVYGPPRYDTELVGSRVTNAGKPPVTWR